MSKEKTAQILEQLSAWEAQLFGASGEPGDALRHLDNADELARQVPGERGTMLVRFIEAQREFTLGLLSLRDEGGLAAALDHFKKAQALARDLKAEFPEQADEASFKAFELGIEAKILEVQLAGKEGQEKDDLLARLDHVRRQQVATSKPSPVRDLAKGVQCFQKVSARLRDSGQALETLNLEDASRYIEEADELRRSSEELLAKSDSLPFVLEAAQTLLLGVGRLVQARRSFVVTLRDAVVGEVTSRHIAELEEADTSLRRGMGEIEKAAPVMLERFGGVMEGSPVEAFRDSVSSQRDIIRNLRHLVQSGLTPKEVGRRSAPRFLFYFLLTFLVVLFGSKWSGLVENFSAGNIVTILTIALAASATASFGYAVGLQFISKLRNPFGTGGKSDGGCSVDEAG